MCTTTKTNTKVQCKIIQIKHIILVYTIRFYLLLCILVFISPARKTNSDSGWDVLHSLREDKLVQRSINANISVTTKKSDSDISSNQIIETKIKKTYEVFMVFTANCLISLTARGALFLKVTPYNLLLIWMV